MSENAAVEPMVILNEVSRSEAVFGLRRVHISRNEDRKGQYLETKYWTITLGAR
jgi:hypothetical protein